MGGEASRVPSAPKDPPLMISEPHTRIEFECERSVLGVCLYILGGETNLRVGWKRYEDHDVDLYFDATVM